MSMEQKSIEKPSDAKNVVKSVARTNKHAKHIPLLSLSASESSKLLELTLSSSPALSSLSLSLWSESSSVSSENPKNRPLENLLYKVL